MGAPILLSGCDSQGDAARHLDDVFVIPQPTVVASTTPPRPPPPLPDCSAPVDVYEHGARVGAVCEGQAEAAGLTVVDLSDDWVPRLFARHGEDPGPAYRETLVALANERLGEGPAWDRPRSDKFFELYGVFPSLRVLAGRLGDEPRHECHDKVDDSPLERPMRDIDPWADRDRQRAEAARLVQVERLLEAERRRRDAPRVEDLRADPKLGPLFDEQDRVGRRPRAVLAMQEHLRCDGLLLSKRGYRGSFDNATTDALRAFQRKHMIVSHALDEETRAILATDSRELDFRGLLRALRERVVDATGLIEDGSAAGEEGEVVARVLDSSAFRVRIDAPTTIAGAPDHVARATDAAARALGWVDAASALEFFRGLGPDATGHLKVALRLPSPPAYHGPRMELRAEIDRGDVWYDQPFTKRGGERAQPVQRRPSLTLYAKDGDREVALLRWPTTIGGWKPERIRPKEIMLSYKLSPPGKRLWREIYAAPAWVPPESTPKRDLVRARYDGSFTTKADLFGPGYASAYGLTALIHHQRPRASAAAADEGIRTHGSASYDSILRGYSHGCHRLFNHQALRLSSFLLAHREHDRLGPDVLGYHRRFDWKGERLDVAIESRGYRFTLDPPVEVEVLPGRILGEARTPAPPLALPERMRKLFRQELLED